MSRAMPSKHVMRRVLAIVAVVVAWVLGSHLGAQAERDRVVAELSSKESEPSTSSDSYQNQITQLRTQRDIATASTEALQESLQQLQAEVLELKSTQRLYEKIEGTNVSSGLGVDTIALVNNEQGKPLELHVTVVQARGRNRVKGRIGVALVGEQDGSNWREVVVSADSDSAAQFDMRFFQTIVITLPEINALVELVEIDVKPDGKTHKPFSYEMDWSSISEN